MSMCLSHGKPDYLQCELLIDYHRKRVIDWVNGMCRSVNK